MLATFEPSIFFSHVRKEIFGGLLKPEQVKGMEMTISAWGLYGTPDRRHLAYVLATEHRETGARMQPVREAFGTSTADTVRKLDASWAAGRMPQVKTAYWRDGWFGRGKVQITWKDNYAKMGKIIGVDLVGNPDLALDPATSCRILIEGVTRGVSLRGDFSKYAVEDFIHGDVCDYVGARKTVNGTDHAREIAAVAKHFDDALNAAGMELFTPRFIPDPSIPRPADIVEKVILAETKTAAVVQPPIVPTPPVFAPRPAPAPIAPPKRATPAPALPAPTYVAKPSLLARIGRWIDDTFGDNPNRPCK